MRTLLLFCLLSLTACATLTAKSDQAIYVTTEPTGMDCTLSNALGSWEIEKTPGSAMVKRSFSPLHIACNQGKTVLTEDIDAKTRGRAWGNVLLTGVPAIVDAATGHGYEYTQDHVTLAPRQ